MAPAVLALVLGVLAEQHLRRALSVSDGDFLTFIERPISLALVALILAVADPAAGHQGSPRATRPARGRDRNRAVSGRR